MVVECSTEGGTTEALKVVYGAETLEENLDFIAESLGAKTNETSRQTIRRYFLKESIKII